MCNILHIDLINNFKGIREAAKNVLFLVAWPLRLPFFAAKQMSKSDQNIFSPTSAHLF